MRIPTLEVPILLVMLNWASTMSYRFVAFHTMTRGTEKPAYVVNCAKALADRALRVLVLDALMYEQGAIPHRLYEHLGAAPINGSGFNLYDLLRDYETLCAHTGGPPMARDEAVITCLHHPSTRFFRGRIYPDVLARTNPIPSYPAISYLPGNNGEVVEVRERIDFAELYDRCEGQRFFAYLKETLSEQFDHILINAPAGHQEISGILCGQFADLILAIDLKSPAVAGNSSYEACRRLVARVREQVPHPVEVKSVKGHSVTEIVAMILGDSP